MYVQSRNKIKAMSILELCWLRKPVYPQLSNVPLNQDRTNPYCQIISNFAHHNKVHPLTNILRQKTFRLFQVKFQRLDKINNSSFQQYHYIYMIRIINNHQMPSVYNSILSVDPWIRSCYSSMHYVHSFYLSIYLKNLLFQSRLYTHPFRE